MELSLFTAMDTSASGLKAQHYRMNIIAENLANVHTTHTDNGEPYRRKEVLVAAEQPMAVFDDFVNTALLLSSALLGTGLSHAPGGYAKGVRIMGVIEDNTPFREVYDPGHPDADAKGMVRLPNVNPVIEMVNMMSATRSYESNITAINAAKRMAEKALEIGA
jgi:flagellar basal-body rod protein FlgC